MRCPEHLCTCKPFLFGIYKEFQLEVQNCARCQRLSSKERPFQKQGHRQPHPSGEERALRSKETRALVVLEAFCGDLAGVRPHSSRKLI